MVMKSPREGVMVSSMVSQAAAKNWKGAGGAGHQGARLADGLAVIEALQLGQRLGTLADQLGHAVQHGGALMGLLLGPAAGAEGMVGLLDGLFTSARLGARRRPTTSPVAG